MYKDLVDPNGYPCKGLRLIGDSKRIMIVWYLIPYLYDGLMDYRKKQSSLYKRISNIKPKTKGNQDFLAGLNKFENIIEKYIITDLRYELYLEKWIMRVFKPDFKDYKGDHSYDHALTNKYHDKRFLL